MTRTTTLFLALAATLAAGPAFAAAPTCVSNADWLVVEQPHKDGVGNSYIIRDTKSTPKPACSLKPAKGDRVIGTSEDPFTLLKLIGNDLLIDSGTGPDRTLLIYDLRNGKTVFQGGYDDEDFKADATGASFWVQRPTKATAKNCPDLASIKKNDLTPTLFALARFDAAQGTVTVSNKTQCRATQ